MQSHVYSVYMYSKFFKLITIFSSLTDISQYMEQNGHSAKDFPPPWVWMVTFWCCSLLIFLLWFDLLLLHVCVWSVWAHMCMGTQVSWSMCGDQFSPSTCMWVPWNTLGLSSLCSSRCDCRVTSPEPSECCCLTCSSRSGVACELTARSESVRLGDGAGIFHRGSFPCSITSKDLWRHILSHSLKVIRAGHCTPGTSVLKFHSDFSPH